MDYFKRLVQFEDALFNQAAISEDTVRADMQNRVYMQNSGMDSSAVAKKKQYYYDNLGNIKNELNRIQTQIWDEAQIALCRRCLAQIDKLFSIINQYQ